MEFITVSFDRLVDRTGFDCESHPSLNTYISQHAGQDEKRHVSRTFMYVENGALQGYYALANTSVALSDLPDDQKRKLPRYPVPAVLLSRLHCPGDGLRATAHVGCFPPRPCSVEAIRGSVRGG